MVLGLALVMILLTVLKFVLLVEAVA